MMNIFLVCFVLFTQHLPSIGAVAGNDINVNNDGYLDISAFNVQIFGQSKMENPIVSETLVKIILRYDLLLMQEIRDSSGQAIIELMELVRKQDPRYSYVISKRLGRSTSKEQYAYIYREDWLTPVEQFVYNDSADVFEREPFITHFKSSRSNVEDFVVVGIHTKPDDAVAEINQLANVYDHIVDDLQIKDVILMGDFNADCDYVKSFEDIALATSSKFYWLITDATDTTTKKTDCAYDRFVIAGENLLKSIVPNSAGVFHFEQAYHLNQEQTEDVSDHYPIQFQITSKRMEENINRQEKVVIRDKSIDKALAGNYRKIYSMKNEAEKLGYAVDCTYTETGAYREIRVQSKVTGIESAVNGLSHMKIELADFVSNDQYYSGSRWILKNNLLVYLPQGNGNYQTLYDFYLVQPAVNYSLTLSCDMANRDKPVCVVNIGKELQYHADTITSL